MRGGGGNSEAAEDAEKFGFPDELVAAIAGAESGRSETEVWRENWPIVEAFGVVLTQWRVASSPARSWFVGLDYSAARAGLELAGIAVTPDLWAGVRAMETEARAALAAGAVLAMTGTDPMPEFRGRYSTAVGSARALKRHGAGTLDATIDGKFPPRAPAFARRGDLVFAHDAVGVAMGPFALFVGALREDDGGPDIARGLTRVARAEWIKAWAVGS